jgi:hypothetical protein
MPHQEKVVNPEGNHDQHTDAANHRELQKTAFRLAIGKFVLSGSQ